MANGVSLAVSELQKHVQSSLVEGAYGSFVPLSEVRSFYSKPHRVQDILKAFHQNTALAKAIQKSYIRVFTILVLIQKAAYIVHFTSYNHLTDEHLPFRSCNEWPEDTKEFFDSFSNEQWKFCPLNLDKHGLNDTHLPDNTILPITIKKVLREGVHSRTSLIEVYPEYDKLSDEASKQENPHKYVLKSCHANEEQSYVNELRAYTLLLHQDDKNAQHDTNEVSKHLLELHGSWRMHSSFNLLLEWADGGSLDNFFQNTEAPIIEEDYFHFWSNLLLIIKPLQRIHELIVKRQEQSVFQGIHQDITPRNILVSSNAGSSCCDVTFKLADFGLTRFEKKPDKGKYIEGTDRQGTQMYSAPECVRNDSFLQHTILPAQPSIDIWAFACILSEAAVWSSRGPLGLTTYLELRRLETDQYKELRDEGYSGCFHNGERVLDAVIQMHQEIRNTHRPTDRFVDQIITLAEDLLCEASSRPTAVTIYRHSCNIIKGAQSRASVHSPSRAHSYPRIFHTKSEKNMTRQLPPQVPPGYSGSVLRTPVTAAGLGIDTGPTPGQGAAPNGNIMERYSPNVTAPRSQGREVSRRRSMPGRSSTELMTRYIPQLDAGNGEPSQHREKDVTYCDTPPTKGVSPKDPLTDPILKTGQSAPVKRTPVVEAPAKKDVQTIPIVSIDEGHSWIGEKKKSKSKNPKTRNSIEPLKGFEFLQELDCRDQIFLIDNSESMRKHWEKVIRVFEVLAYFAKQADPDNMELYFTHSKERVQRKHRKELIRIIKKADTKGRCNMKNRLARVLEKWIEEFEKSKNKRRIIPAMFSFHKPKDGVNIYVFTDGVWLDGPSPVCGVDEPIKETVDKLIAKGFSTDHVGIQFIRFGKHDKGIKRLLQLDCEPKKFQIQKDIVDTEPWDGNMLKMLLGAFNPFFDGDGEKVSPEVGSPATKNG